MTEIETMLIEHACERLVKQFCHGNDFNAIEAMADVFAEDGSFARPLDPTNPTVGRDAIYAMLKARGPRVTRHMMSNILIDVISADEARGVSYVTFITTTDIEKPYPLTPEPKIFTGEYRDHFVRTAAGWKIKSRQGSLSMVMNIPT